MKQHAIDWVKADRVIGTKIIGMSSRGIGSRYFTNWAISIYMYVYGVTQTDQRNFYFMLVHMPFFVL